MGHHYGWHRGAKISKLLTTQENLFLLFYLHIDGNMKRLEYYKVRVFCSVYCANVF